MTCHVFIDQDKSNAVYFVLRYSYVLRLMITWTLANDSRRLS